MQSIDSETGEVLPPRMPPEIAGAIIKVMKAAKSLGHDERNQHGGYSYVSIDKFLEHCGPLMADAGLMTLFNEMEVSFRDGPPGKDGRVTSWAMPRYDVWLVHESGVMWGPLRRHLALPMTGPQTFGSAESYLQKRLYRGLFMIPTGEKDADAVEPRYDAPIGRAAAPQTQGRLREHLSMPTTDRTAPKPTIGGNGSHPTGPPATSPAEARFKEIRAEIDAADTIDALNATGLWRETREADEALLSAVKFKTPSGETTAWGRLIERDTSRRLIIAGPEGDIVA